MAKQLNVSLAFTADTSKAKAQIQELQTALNKLGSMSAISNDNGIQAAAKAAKELSYHLNKAFNANTGNLDLSKFNASLSKSNTNITKLSTQLLQAGNTGKQAFMNLAQSISTAEYPMLRINSRMQEFMTTLKNTARWQISSSILHGFMGAIQNAYSYAQDLNQSLNNIRIVTGYNADQMANFATQANKAAQVLSTTTTSYTDAALIYYQQGIRDQEEIAERTATTIKLANVSRQSAEEVSQQMTAIWNNFYDGSQNLEYYADAITALGASTASSSQEIATGLEKFAAVSKTVGLSYEYATAALATITAQTRQSADTVGTGLRTLFARLESLKLGESLEDGVDLNKYSKALHDVGVEVLDTSGQMRNMDNILDDLATRWNNLGQAQKMALAQTVGGVRQYTNLIALMDNWDKMQQNILTAQESEGTLQKQAEIYGESWEAARDRVKNALQGIYQNLLDDKFFIGLNETFASVLKGINAFINGIGGLKTIIISVSSLILSHIADKIGPALNALKYNLQVIFTGAQTQAQTTIMQMDAMLEKQKATLGSAVTDPNNASEIQQLTNIQQLTMARSKLMMETKNLSDEERNMAEFQLQGLASQQQHVQNIADEISALENLNIKYREQLDNGSKADGIVKESTSTLKEFEAEINSVRNAMMEEDAEINQLEQELTELYEITDQYKDATEQTKMLGSDMAKTMGEEAQAFLQTNKSLQNYKKTISSIVGVKNNFTTQVDKINEKLQQLSKNGNLTDRAFEEIRSEVELLIKVIPKTSQNAEELRKILSKLITTQVNQDVNGFAQVLESLKTTFNGVEITGNNFKTVIQQIAGDLGGEYLTSLEKAAQKQRELEEENRKLNQAFQEFDPTHTVTGIERVVLAAGTLGQVSMMINSLRNLISVWNNDELTFGEKLTSAFMSISMVVPSVITVFGNLSKLMPGLISSFGKYTVGLKLVDISQKEVTASLVTLSSTQVTAEATEKALTVTKGALLAACKAHGVAMTAETAATVASAIASNLKAGMSQKEAIQAALTTAGVEAETAAKIADTLATQGLTAAISAMLGPIGWVIAAITALVTVLTLVSNHYKKAEEAAMEFAKKQAEAMEEATATNKEENSKLKDLYNEYLNTKKALDGSETSKKNYQTATEKLCQALGVEYSALDMLQEKYEELDKEILKGQESKLREAIKKGKESRTVLTDDITGKKQGESTAGYNLYKAAGLNDNSKIKYYDQSFYAADGSGLYFDPHFTLTDSRNDGNVVYQAIAEYLESNYSDIYKYTGKQAEGYVNSMQFKANVSDFEVFDALHTALENIDWSETQFQTTNAKNALQEIQNIFKDNEFGKAYAAHIDSLKEEQELQAQLVSNLLAQEGFSASDVTTDNYEKYKAQFIEKAKQEFGLLTNEASDLFDNYAITLSENIKNSKNIVTATTDAAERSGLNKDILEQYRKQYGDELFFSINFDTVKSEYSLKRQLNYLQGIADKDSIKTQFEFIDSNKKDLKKDMSADDYIKFQESSGIAWGQEGPDGEKIIEYSEFLQKSYDEQVEYYNKVYDIYEQTYLKSLEENKKATEYNIQLTKIQQQSALEDIKNFKSGIESFLQSKISSGDLLGDFDFDEFFKIFDNVDSSNMEDSLDRIEKFFIGTKYYTDSWNPDFWKSLINQMINAKNSVEGYSDELVKLEKTNSDLDLESQNIDIKAILKEQELINTLIDEAETLDELLNIQGTYDVQSNKLTEKQHELALNEIQEIKTLDDLLNAYDKYKQYLTDEEISEKLLKLTTNFIQLKHLIDDGKISIEQYKEKCEQLKETLISEADSLDALDAAFSLISEYGSGDTELTLTFEEQSQALLNLASSFDNAAQEIEKYNVVVANLSYNDDGSMTAESKAALDAATDNLRAAIRAGEAASKYGLDAQVIEKQAKEIRAINEDLQMSAEISTKLAIANQRMNKGVLTLHENFEDWRKTLESSEETSKDYAEAVVDIENAVRDLVAATDDWELPDGFLKAPENLDLIAKAAEGDELAINELGNKLAESSVELMSFNENLANAYNEAFGERIDIQTFDEAKNIVLDGIRDIYNNLEALNNESMTIDEAMNGMGESWVAGLNQMAIATGMSVDQMNNLLNQLGVQAKVDVLNIKQPMEVPTYDEYTEEQGERTFTYTADVPDGNGGYKKETYTQTAPVLRRFSVPGPPVTVEGYQQVAQIGTVEGENPPPQISFTGVGGTANRGPVNRGGGVSKSSTPPPKATKTSTPKATKKEVKEHKDLTDEKERYHLINQQIERQTNLLDRLSKNKDRAFGPNKQKYYAQELKSLKDMGKMYEEHLRQSSAYLAQDKAVMQAWGAQISAKDGSILNYDALLKAQVDAYNRAVDRYNASGQTDADKDALKAAEDRFKKFQDDLKQYEDTVKTHEEDINKYIDNMIEQYDTMQAKTADAIEFRIEYDDSVLDFLDKLIDRLDSWNGSMFAAVDIMGKLNDKTSALIEKNKDLETATAETLEHFLMDYKEFDKNGNITFQTGLSKQASQEFIGRFNVGELTTEDIQMLAHMPEEERQLLMDYAQQRQDNTDALIETAQAVVDDVERQFNDAKDELAEAARPIREATAALDNYAAIIDIVGADYLGVTDDIMLRFRDQQWNVLHDTTMANKATMEALGEQRDMIEQLMNQALAAGDDELAEMYREKLKGINDEVQSATEEWYSSWQAELSKLEDDFEKHIDEIKNKALDLAAGPNNTWQSLKDTMDYAQKAAERFLPEYKEIYEFSKLNRDINKSIDDTDNIKNKQALKKLQEEINKLQERSGEISQYDLDNARRKYELELARLALEDARNAKEVVRLSKDSEGNWSYIYTANEEDVANAEQNYEDKLYAMQSANADYINNLQGQLTQATEDYYNKVAEINLVYKDDDDRRREELAKAKARYEETMGYYSNELQKAMDNNKELYEEDWAWYSDYTKKINDDQGYRLGELDNYITDFNDTMLGMATGYDSLAAMEDAMLDHAADAERQMNEAYEHLAAQIELSMADAGTSVGEFAQEMMEHVDGTIVPKADEGRDAVETLADETVDSMQALVDQADAWRRKYEDDMQAIIDKNNLVVKSIQDVTGALSVLHKQEIGHDESTGGSPENPEGSGTGSTGVGKDATGSGSKYSRSDFMNYTYSGNGTDRKYYINGQYVGRIVGFENGVSVQDTTEAKVIQALINAGIWGNNYTAGTWNPVNHRSKEEIFKQFGFRSGGYTGEWAGNEGRLAMLHQKELVLDEDDTKNMLKSVEIIRSLASMIDLNAKASEFAIGNLSAASAKFMPTQLEQTVTISAEFPNATDRNEIAEAFDILINQASQYANRKY